MAPARLFDGQMVFLGRPAANRSRGIGWMHRIHEQHRFVWAERVLKLLVIGNEGLLFFRIQAAADDLRLVVFQS